MKPGPDGTPSPFAARTRVQTRPPGAPTPAGAAAPPGGAAGAAASQSSSGKKGAGLWIAAAGVVGVIAVAAFFLTRLDESTPSREADGAVDRVVKPESPAAATRDLRADFKSLVAEMSVLELEPQARAAAASALVAAEGGAVEEAVNTLGPLVSEAIDAVYAKALEDMRGIRFEDHATSAARELRILTSLADAAKREGVWAEAVAKRRAALDSLPQVRVEIAASLSGMAEEALVRNDIELATFFYTQVLRLKPASEAARAHLFEHKYEPGQVVRNRLGMTFGYAPPGEFLRGSPANEPGRDADEAQGRVRLTKGFFIGLKEVSQREWDAVFGPGAAARVISSSPAKSKEIGPDLPMHSITFAEAEEFCRRLGERDGAVYRLPTEAEWEYACRAGSRAAFSTGTDYLSAREANIDDGSATALFASAAVGVSGPANAWGLFDVHGNVWEWCADWSAPYEAGELVDPRGLADDQIGRVDLAMRVVRGGGWNAPASDARSASRWEFSPVAVTAYIGFRVVMEPDLLAP